MRAAALCMLAAVGAAASESAFLLVHKTVDSPNAVATRNLTVTVSVFNVGAATAHDVKLDDTQWPEGGVATEWASIEAGGSASHTHTVLLSEVPSNGVVETAPATVTYALEAGSSNVRKVTSNDIVDVHYSGLPRERPMHPRNVLDVLSPEEADRRDSRRIKEWITFALLLIIPVAMPAFFAKQSSNLLDEKRAAISAALSKEPAKAAAQQRTRGSSSRGSRGKGKKRSPGKK